METENKKVKVTQANIIEALDALKVDVSFDQFQKKIIIERSKPTDPTDRLPPEILQDHHEVMLRMEIDRRFHFLPPRELFHDVLVYQAHVNAFHPVRDYLDDLKWDGKPRIDTWLTKFGGAENTPYTRAVGRLVLVAAVRRVRQPGCKFDEMMILESAQGKLKSSALRILAVRDEWFTDDLPLNVDSKEMIERTRGKWIVEAGELNGMGRGDRAKLKACLSRQVDEARMAYGRNTERQEREFIIIGTTNDECYLTDVTGDRRYWPVEVALFNLEHLRANVDQLWAEAAYYESQGESIRLDPDLWPQASDEQDRRKEDNPYVAMLAPVLGGKIGTLHSVDIWPIVGVAAGDATPRQQTLFGAALKELGWVRSRPRLNGTRLTVWSFMDDDHRQFLKVRGDGAYGWRLEEPGPSGPSGPSGQGGS